MNIEGIAVKESLSAYAVHDGGYIDDAGIHHADATDLIQVGLLNFCNCGDAPTNLRYVLRGLALIDEHGPDESHGRSTWDAWYQKHKAQERDLFGADAAALFFYYWATARDFAEHGGNVAASWLTEDGHRLLSLLREWEATQAQ